MSDRDSNSPQGKVSPQTRWLHRNDLIRPGVYITRESWQRFEMALQIENFQWAEDGKPPVSRTDIIQAFVEKWSERRLDADYSG